MISDKLSLAESLDRMAALEQKLKDLGVPAESIDGVMEHIDEYVELRDGLNQARNDQFHDEAYDILADLKSASNKNVEGLAYWLRKFALHVAFHTISLTQVYGGDASAIVDRVPPMTSSEDEEE